MRECECCLNCYIIDACKARCKFDCEKCIHKEKKYK